MRPRSRTGAILLIVIGTIFLLVNLGMLQIREIAELLGKWWPLILIGIGAWQLARPRGDDR